jgi:NADH dehydrogenase
VIRNVLVLGGSGFVGRSVCERLVERNGGGGGRITVPSRRPQRMGHLRTLPTVDVVAGSLHDEPSLGRLIRGHDAIINLVAILHGSGAEFQRVHVELPQRLARLASAYGIQRVVHVGALGANTQNPAEAPSNYLRSKSEGELALRRAIAGCTVLRPSVIFGEHDRFTNLFAGLQQLAPVMPLAGASATFQPVWVEDVARAIVQSLDDDRAVGQTIECAGPQVLTLAELVRQCGRWAGCERPVLPLPGPLARLQALALEWAPGPTLMSRDNLDSMRVPNVATGKLPGLDLLGIAPTALDAIAPTYLAARNGAARFNRWRASARRP